MFKSPDHRDADNVLQGYDPIKIFDATCFLAIEMRCGNAVELLNWLIELNFEIIFVIAFDQYAINAAVNKIKWYAGSIPVKEKIATLLHNPHPDRTPNPNLHTRFKSNADI